jgi:prepilin-type N-terminal cleavage/methylation domain-containing protein
MANKNSQRGFTLIELLVVISIISLLSSVVLAGLATARKKGQDGQVVAQRRQIQLALELYYSNNGGYPNPTPGSVNAFCVGNTDCMLVGAPINTQLTALSLSSIKSASIPDISGNVNRGHIYISCGLPTPTCPSERSFLISTTYKSGVTYQKVGLWTTPGAYPNPEIPYY